MEPWLPEVSGDWTSTSHVILLPFRHSPWIHRHSSISHLSISRVRLGKDFCARRSTYVLGRLGASISGRTIGIASADMEETPKMGSRYSPPSVKSECDFRIFLDHGFSIIKHHKASGFRGFRDPQTESWPEVIRTRPPCACSRPRCSQQASGDLTENPEKCWGVAYRMGPQFVR